MSSLQVTTVLAGLAVSDSEVDVGWYRILLGRDARLMARSADRTVPGNRTWQIVHDPARAGGTVTLQVVVVADAPDDPSVSGINMTTDDSAPRRVGFGPVADSTSVTPVEPTSGLDSPAAEDAR